MLVIGPRAPVRGYRAVLDRHVLGIEMGEDFPGRGRGDQAQVRAAPRGPGGVRGDLLPGLVQVDLAGAEFQGAAPGAEGDRAHAQHPLVEASRLVEVGDGQDQVVQAGDGHR